MWLEVLCVHAFLMFDHLEDNFCCKQQRQSFRWLLFITDWINFSGWSKSGLEKAVLTINSQFNLTWMRLNASTSSTFDLKRCSIWKRRWYFSNWQECLWGLFRKPKAFLTFSSLFGRIWLSVSTFALLKRSYSARNLMAHRRKLC